MKIHSFGSDTPQQLVLMLHGYGADGLDLLGIAKHWQDILPNALFIAPDAPQPCEVNPMGHQWFSLQPYEIEHIMRGVKEIETTLQDFIAKQLAKHRIAANKLAIMGFSQGSMLAMYIGMRLPKAPACVLGYSGKIVHQPAWDNEIISKPPVCLIHGTDDMVVPFEEMAFAKEEAEKLGVEIATHARKNLGHGIDPQGVAIGKDFLKKHLN